LSNFHFDLSLKLSQGEMPDFSGDFSELYWITLPFMSYLPGGRVRAYTLLLVQAQLF
jgi:hypothetical protein